MEAGFHLLQMMSVRPSVKTRRVLAVLLGVGFILALRMFAQYLLATQNAILQQDFSCMYTAGESANHGLSAYRNYFFGKPRIWDGLAMYAHSRFIYPPVTLFLFQPLALLPYPVAKMIWTGLILVNAGFAIALSARLLKLKMNVPNLMVLGLVVCLYLPLYNEIEKGQINTLTLVLNVLAIFLMQSRSAGKGIAAGILLAASSMLKLYSLFFLPFLWMRRQYKPLQGFCLGLAGLLLLSAVVQYPVFSSYFREHLPRISQHGGEGAFDYIVSWEDLRGHWARHGVFPKIVRIRDGMPAALPFQTVKNGKPYYIAHQPFFQQAGLVFFIGQTSPFRTLYKFLARFHFAQHGKTLLSGGMLLVFLLFFYPWQRAENRACRAPDRYEELIYWQIVMIIILLCGMLTWSMNTVWLLPAVVILVYDVSRWQDFSPARRLFWSIAFAGMVFLNIPDRWMWSSAVGLFWQMKYVIAQILVLAGLAGLLALSRRQRQPAGESR